jgi:hypothetical protein
MDSRRPTSSGSQGIRPSRAATTSAAPPVIRDSFNARLSASFSPRRFCPWMPSRRGSCESASSTWLSASLSARMSTQRRVASSAGRSTMAAATPLCW